MNFVCISVDRFHAGYLGPYGNAWVATPWFNRLAAEGTVMHQAFTAATDLEPALQALWSGRHPLAVAQPPVPTLAERFRSAGFQTALVTDDPRVAALPAVETFDQCLLKPATDVEQRAESIEATQFSGLLAEAAQLLDEVRDPLVLWIHTATLARPWDAPIEFYQRYLDEEDEPIDPPLAIPDEAWDSQFDPDHRSRIMHAYAAQLAALDASLAEFGEILRSSPSPETCLVVVGLRGVALGEHGYVGRNDAQLTSSVVQVPWLWRFSDGRGFATGHQALAQTIDLAPTLYDLAGLPPLDAVGLGHSLKPLIDPGGDTWRDRIVLSSSAERAIRTRAWYLRQVISNDDTDTDSSPRTHLYAKPDDFWDTNEVASRCPEEVAALEAALVETEQSLATGAPLNPLPELLQNTLRG